MNLAHPASLAWFALAIPIVVFYILKARQRRVPVSTNLFWRQIFEEKQPRSLWEYLRHLLSLLVQMAMLALLVFALTEPFFRWEVLEAKRIALIIDNSASMKATDVAPSRLAKAKEEAKRIIDGLRFRDEMAIIAAGTQPQVYCGLTGHQRSLRSALDTIAPTDGPTRIEEAVALARRLLADTKNRKILVLTDGCFPNAEKLAKATDVEAMGVGRKTGNVGITQFQVRRSLIDPVGYEILAEVANDSEEPVECRLEIELEGSVVDVVPLKLEPGKPWTHVFEKTSTFGGKLTGKLNRPDAFLTDNQAFALLPLRQARPVTLVTEGNLFLEKVFQAIPLIKLAKTADVPKAPEGTTLTIFHHKVPEKLPPGPLFVIDPTGSCDLWDLAGKLENPIVTEQDRTSPLMAHVRLDNVMMPEARQLKPKDMTRVHVLATALSGDPLFCSIDRPEGRVLVLTVDLDKSDLPLQTAFPIMVTNALSWFSGNKGELRESIASGSTTDVEVAKTAGTLLLRAPDGQARPLPPGGGKLTIGPLDQCGIWSVVRASANARKAEPPEIEVACNLANKAESDLRPPEGLLAQSAGIASGYGGRPIWFYLLVTAWGLVALEWFLYQRRWIS